MHEESRNMIVQSLDSILKIRFVMLAESNFIVLKMVALMK